MLSLNPIAPTLNITIPLKHTCMFLPRHNLLNTRLQHHWHIQHPNSALILPHAHQIVVDHHTHPLPSHGLTVLVLRRLALLVVHFVYLVIDVVWTRAPAMHAVHGWHGAAVGVADDDADVVLLELGWGGVGAACRIVAPADDFAHCRFDHAGLEITRGDPVWVVARVWLEIIE